MRAGNNAVWGRSQSEKSLKPSLLGEGSAVQWDQPVQGQRGSSLVAGVATDSLLPPWLDGKQTGRLPPACQCSPVL